MIGQAVLPTLKTLFKAPASSPLSEVDPWNVAYLLLTLTDSIHLKKNAKSSEKEEESLALLRNMKPDLQDFNDRTLLKNLGHFLGLITLGKNKPILHDDINFKDLLYEAFHKSAIEMHYVVPFVARTMEGAADSLVFKPPNPWTMGLLKVLKELHGENTVRLNLKFEVEILCKRLDFDFNSLEPAYFLRDDSYHSKIESQLCFVVSNQERQAGHLPPVRKPVTMPSSSVGVSMSNEPAAFTQSEIAAIQDQHAAFKQTLSNDNLMSNQTTDVGMYGLMPTSVMQSQMQQCIPSSKPSAGHVSTTPPQSHAKLRYSDINLKANVLQYDGMITRFLRLATVFVVERYHTKLKQEPGVPHARLASYTELDAYARLVSMLVKYEKGQKKISLLNKALGIIAGTLLQEHEVRQEWFHPMPFHRILVMLFLELNSTEDNVMIPYQTKVLTAFCNVLHVLRPCRASSFVYSWLEIVSHRTFVTKMFSEQLNPQELKPMYAQLIVDLLKYIRFYLMNELF